MKEPSRINRRAFLGSALAGAASLAARSGIAQEQDHPRIQGEPPKAPTGVRVLGGLYGAKRLIQPSDFEYAGSFILPNSFKGMDVRFSRGLAHRYVGADLRFFSAIHKTPDSPARDGEIVEFGFPGLGLKDPMPTAPVIRQWGDIFQDKMVLGTPGNSRILLEMPRGLWWDEQDERLYWSYGCGGDDSYCPRNESVTLGASTLNQLTGKGTAIGSWRIGPAPYKCVIRGCVPIPQWFAQAHTGGRRIAAGFGGYFSLMNNGAASLGPSLWAIDPPNTPHMSTIDATMLVSYHPPNAKPYTRPLRCQRPADYKSTFDGWQPKDGIGYWAWTDEIHQACAWIDLPDRHGVLFFPVLGEGLVYYTKSDRHAETAHHWWMALDPYDLAKVLHGELARDLVVPAWWNEVRYARVAYPTDSGWNSASSRFFGNIPRVVGSTFDSSTKTLFLLILTKGWPYSEQTILAYRVK